MWTAWGFRGSGCTSSSLCHGLLPAVAFSWKERLYWSRTTPETWQYIISSPTPHTAWHWHYSLTCSSLLRYWHVLTYRIKASLCPCSSCTATLRILRILPNRSHDLIPRIFKDFLFLTTRVHIPALRAVIMFIRSFFQFLLANSGVATKITPSPLRSTSYPNYYTLKQYYTTLHNWDEDSVAK